MKNGYLVFLLPSFFIAFIFSGCGMDYQFKRAQKMEDNGRFEEALAAYNKIAEKYPNSSRCPEALYKTGIIYKRSLNEKNKAKQVFKKLISEYEGTDWANFSMEEWLEIADYYPMYKNTRRVYVDSDTMGRYMKEVSVFNESKNGFSSGTRKVYVRGSEVGSFRMYFKNTGSGVYETDSSGNTKEMIFPYPLETGKTWNSNGYEFSVVSKSENVKVGAGVFSGCVKIKKKIPGVASFQYIYYAPDVGVVLTTQSAGASEKRVSELKEYEVKFE